MDSSDSAQITDGKLVESTESPFDRYRAFLARVHPIDLSLLMTTVLLLLYAGKVWYLDIPIRVLALLGLFIAPLRTNPRYWFIIMCFLVSANGLSWFRIDNHKYLMTYWLIAIAIATNLPEEQTLDFLARTARLLIGLCFAAAVIAKLLSPDFVNGNFMLHTMLFDSRFDTFTWLIGGVDDDVRRSLHALLYDLRSGYRKDVAVTEFWIPHSPRLLWVAHALTWWTLLWETMIAIAFLVRYNNPRIDSARQYLLWIFILATYSVALVSGFAWLLITMGIAQSPKNIARTRTLYFLLAAVVIQVYRLPLGALLHGILGAEP